ncbi:uncharacterized protein LOC123659444 [Melitaea cinxia]|uniref:uncharacterized protein LOC123659444 n=1 Tax=Melitaea cinxia TaxID=113334 RepID=UPI001E271B7F|nr:uncharacterized protein LOC123659444 [Melitaea cinxia]
MLATTNTTLKVSLESLPKELQGFTKRIIERTNYKKYDIEVKYFDTRGNNFLAEPYEIDITGEVAEGEKKTNIFVKWQIPQQNFKLLPIENVYSNEVFIYKDLSHIFTTLQDEAIIPQKDRYKIAKSYEETDNTVIILENLSKKGFRTYAKAEVISIKYAQLAIKEMAKFHALTFVIEEKLPEYYNNKIKVIKSPFIFNDDWAGLMRNICAHVASLYDNDVKERVKNFSSTLIEKLPKYYNSQNSVKCTLNHGDYKKNNLLVRMQDGEVVEIVPVDYQLIHYGSPIMDFLSFIFTSTDREFRKKHLTELKELYFETLSSFLKYFSMDVEAVYPRKEFEKVYTEWLDFGLMMTLYSSFVMFAPDTKMELAGVNFSDLPFCPDKKYDYLYRGLIDDFIEWGYL